jgi:hypothetical protein
MGADLVLLTDCPVKQQLGEGDAYAGSDRLYKLTKQRGHAELVAEMMKRDGKDPATATFQHVVNGPNGPVQRELSVKALFEATAVLDDLAPHCVDCPANCFAETFGCVSYLQYPVPESAEAWLVKRVQSADTFGGQLLLKAIKDFGYTGQQLASWRERGLLASKAPTYAVVKKGFLSSTKVSADQLLEAVLTVGEPLQPTHCLLFLLFLGALRLDGQVPTAKDDPTPLATLMVLSKGTVEQRRARTALDVGPDSDEDGAAAMQRLLRAVYQAWLLDDPLWVDA